MIRRFMVALAVAISASLLAVVINVATASELPPALAFIEENPWLIAVILTVLSAAITLVAASLPDSASEIHVAAARRFNRRETARIRSDLVTRIARFTSVAERDTQLDGAELPSRMSRRPGAVRGIWDRDSAPPLLPDEHLSVGITDVARACGYNLLILGGPGSGKSRQLLHLFVELQQRASGSNVASVPVLIRLTEWAKSENEPLRSWLSREIHLRWGLPMQVADEWIEVNNFIFLFDGLDELREDRRSACVNAINDFREKYNNPSVVVCCRTDAYDLLSVQLHLEDAIVIEPLRAGDIDALLRSLGDQAALVAVLRDDNELRRMLDSPLLVQVAIQAFHGRTAEAIRGQLDTSDRRRLVFDEYVRTALGSHDRRLSNPAGKHTDLICRLRILANELRKRQETAIYPEWLQPDWLPPGVERTLVTAGVSILGGVLVALLATISVRAMVAFGRALPFDADPGADFGATVGLNFGLTLGISLWITLRGQTIEPVEQLDWSWRTVRTYSVIILSGGALAGAAIGASGVVVNGLTGASLLVGALQGMTCGVVCVLVFGIVAGMRVRPALRPASTWNSPSATLRTARAGAALYGLAGALVGGLAFGPASLLFAGIPLSPSGFFLATWASGWTRPLAIVAISVLASVVVIGFLAGLALESKPSRTAPRRRWRGGRRVLLFGVVFGTAGVVSGGAGAVQTDHALSALSVGMAGGWLDAIAYGPVGGLVSALLGGVAIGSTAGLTGWFTFGGAVWIRHWILRIALVRRGLIPFNFRDFLEHAETHSLLVPVPGGLAFYHEALRDHFAADEPSSTADGESGG